MGLRFVFAVLLLVGCGGPTTPGELSGVGAVGSVGGETIVRHDDGPLERRFGRIQYEARSPTPTGASAARELRAGRWLRLRFVRGDRVLVETRSDGLGAFDAQVPAAADALLVDARIQFQEHDLEVTADRAGEEGYSHRVELGGPAATALDVRIGDDGDGLAGAFHILDRMLDGSLAVREWTGRELAPFYAYWGRGVTTDWSFYLGRCGDAEAGRYCIELLGGEPGQQSTTDTDEHDDAIILHEFGHFVMDQLSTSSSHGGGHPGGLLLDPGLAWEEGRASWFALSVMRQSAYEDTIGLEGSGELRVNHQAERRGTGIRGQGSELGVLEILWDLTDGTDDIADADDDGVALGPARLLRAMLAMREVPGSYPTISTFLAYLLEQQEVSVPQLERIYHIGGHPADLHSPSSVALWPRDLELGQWAGGKIDGLTNPAPSGGAPRPQNGYDAVHVYRVQVRERGILNVHLEIDGSGQAREQTDVDIELRDIRGDELASSREETPQEVIARMVEPGFYLVYVRDGGSGNRASYRLRVSTGW